jgi:hypothetical protein
MVAVENTPAVHNEGERHWRSPSDLMQRVLEALPDRDHFVAAPVVALVRAWPSPMISPLAST